MPLKKNWYPHGGGQYVDRKTDPDAVLEGHGHSFRAMESPRGGPPLVLIQVRLPPGARAVRRWFVDRQWEVDPRVFRDLIEEFRLAVFVDANFAARARDDAAAPPAEQYPEAFGEAHYPSTAARPARLSGRRAGCRGAVGRYLSPLFVRRPGGG